MSDWYRQDNTGISGPFSDEELQFLKERGQLSGGDKLRLGEDGPWQAAGNVKAIFPSRSSSARAAAKQPSRQPQVSRPVELEPAGMKTPPASGSESIPNPSPPQHSVGLPSTDGRRKSPLRWAAAGGVILALLLVILALWLLKTVASQHGAGHGVADSGTGGGGSTANRDTIREGVAQNSGGGDQKREPTRSKPVPPGRTLPSKTSPPAPDSAAIAGSRFFGLKAGGDRFVYIVDCSGSMAGEPFEKARNELLKSIHNLGPKQSFYVIFFSDVSYPMFSPNSTSRTLLPASVANVKRVTTWITNFAGGGVTEPQDALLRALALGPDAVFFLTDGGFDDAVVDTVRQRNTKKASINTVGFGIGADEKLLKRFAAQNRGRYIFVP